MQRQVNIIYERLLKARPEIGDCRRCNNINILYRNILVKIFKRIVRSSRYKAEAETLRLQFEQINMNASIECVRKLLGIEQLRRYVKAHYISKKKLIADILKGKGDCGRKKHMLDCYPQFVAAVDNPSSLTRWL